MEKGGASRRVRRDTAGSEIIEFDGCVEQLGLAFSCELVSILRSMAVGYNEGWSTVQKSAKFLSVAIPVSLG